MRRRLLTSPRAAPVAVTIGAALAAAARRLGPALRPDAEVLLAHVLGTSRSALLARDDRPLPPSPHAAFERLVERRRTGEPVAYLTGTKEFWSLPLKLTPAVLIPRPETELLVEWALRLAPFAKGGRREAAGGFSVLDLGTGSGAIALAIAKERPDATVTATDISAAALGVARDNAQRLGIRNVTWVRQDFFETLDAGFRRHDGEFDLVVSNPPYVAEGDPHLDDLRFEPAPALLAGADGLDALRVIVDGARNVLAPGGWLLVEHGAAQGAAVRELFRAAGFDSIETRRDPAAHERVTGGRAPPDSSTRGQA